MIELCCVHSTWLQKLSNVTLHHCSLLVLFTVLALKVKTVMEVTKHLAELCTKPLAWVWGPSRNWA